MYVQKHIGKNEEAYNVGVFVYDKNDIYVGLMKDALLEEFTDSTDIYIQAYDGENDNELQLKQIDAKIKSGVDLLVVSCHSYLSSGTIVEKAKAANVPIIFFHRHIPEDVLNSYGKASFVSVDVLNSGVMQGYAIYNSLVRDWDENTKTYKTFDKNGDGKISCAIFTGQNGNPEAELRKNSYLTANQLLSDAGMGTIEVKGINDANWDMVTAYNIFTMYYSFSTLPEIVTCGNDGIAQGVISALNDIYPNGYNLPGSDAAYYVPVFGFDGNAMEAIANGSMEGTVKVNPDDIGVLTADMIKNCLYGNDLLYGTGYNFIPTSKTVKVGYYYILREVA